MSTINDTINEEGAPNSPQMPANGVKDIQDEEQIPARDSDAYFKSALYQKHKQEDKELRRRFEGIGNREGRPMLLASPYVVADGKLRQKQQEECKRWIRGEELDDEEEEEEEDDDDDEGDEQQESEDESEEEEQVCNIRVS